MQPTLNMQPKKGYFILLIGPMFSGKTKTLNKLTYDYTVVNNYKTLKITHSLVNGSERNNKTYNNTLTSYNSIYLSDLSEMFNEYTKFDVIAIDEGQFFDKSIIDFVKHYLSLGKIIILSGLTTDYRIERFGFLSDLIYCADEVLHKHAKCSKCADLNIKTKAPFTERSGPSKDKIHISSEYIPVCRGHHHIYEERL